MVTTGQINRSFGVGSFASINVESTSIEPANPSKGDIYFQTSDNKLNAIMVPHGKIYFKQILQI